jgi:glycosyltransferase involved in cell wall biosynthesis
VARVLYAVSRRNTFTRIDRDALAERHDVVDYYQPGFRPSPLELWNAVRSCDLVFGWFASWHTALALRLARIARKPSVLIFGGFDTAAMPEIGYGSQRGGVRRRLVRGTAGMATRLITNSNSSLREIEDNVGLDPARVRVVYHGIPDRFPDAADRPERERMALTVGAVYSVNLARKGHGPFMEAARLVPDVEWVLAGEWWDETGERLSAEAPANARVTGRLSDDDLDDLFGRCGVYVQASLHEGFGLSLAEAMLAGAVPVVTGAGALPEVVGDTGVVIDEPTPDAVAAGVRRAFELGRPAGLAARERVRTHFTYEMRRDGVLEEVERALAGERS